MSIFGRLLHLVRLILSATVHRNVEHETDELSEEDKREILRKMWNDAAAKTLADPASVPITSASLVLIRDDDSTPVEVPTPLVIPQPLDNDPTPDTEVEKDESDLPLLTVGADGWLIGDKVVRVPTKRGGFRWRMKTQEMGGLLWHWTATSHGTALTMARRIVEPAPGGSSVHLWIEYDGTIYQSTSFKVGSGHAGGKTAARCKDVNGAIKIVPATESVHSINAFAGGIEIVNVGEVRPVTKQLDGSYVTCALSHPDCVMMAWPFGVWKTREVKKRGATVTERYVAKGPIISQSEAMQAKDRTGRIRWYQMFTMMQIEAAERIIRACIDRYGFTKEMMSWGHIDVDPSRKADPGPLWAAHLDEIFETIEEDLVDG